LGEAPSREQHAGTAPAPKPKAAKIWQPTPEQQAFFDHVATLPPEEQAKAVAEKLKEVNPGFDGTTEHKVEGGQVVAFTCHSEHLVDIWPVRALRHLKQLGVGGVNSKRIAKLADLSPLRGLSLRQLTVFNSLVDDLTPLAGMPLEVLNCEDTRVKDLSPLKGMPLKYLLCGRTLINDLSPLEGMSLDFLRCD